MKPEIDSLGDYNIIKQIGQGSLGSVYLAEHRFMKKQYAIKVLPDELSCNRGFIARFEKEISILSKLDHPHIVKVYNISFSDGHYFIVSDCIVDSMGETSNLTQFLAEKNGKIPETTVLEMLSQIASALDYAHQIKPSSFPLVHRNLKLNNILIGPQEGNPELILSDFGLSHIIGSGAVLSRTYHTLANALNVTPIEIDPHTGQEQYPRKTQQYKKLKHLHRSFLQNYSFLAPEQKVATNPQEISPRVDAYAFGVLAYYLIARKFPEGIFDMPSELEPTYKFNWDHLIKKCLQQDPQKRPENLQACLDEVQGKAVALGHYHPPIEKIVEKKAPATNPYITQSQQSVEKTPSASRQSQVLENEHTKQAVQAALQVQEKIETIAQPIEDTNPSLKPQITNPYLKPLIQTGELQRPEYEPDPAAALNVDSTVTVYHPKPKPIKNIEPLLTDMAIVEGGIFIRGSFDGNRDEVPCHEIELDSFAFDIHPVTNEQFIRFLEVMDSEKDANSNDMIRLRESRIKRISGKLSIESGYSKHPVVGVTWYGATAYAKWVGKRLPTEAEWEIANRSTIAEGPYPTGVSIEKNQANFFSSDTTAVMSYQPNTLGIYDLAGNVYEWCQDWYGYNYYEVSAQEPQNPKGPLQGVYRVLRGGCWKSLKEDLRFTHRHRNNPGTFNGTYGFRCATDAKSD